MRILLFAFLAFSASFNVKGQTQPKQPTANGKIGYFDIDNVIVQLPEFKQLEVKLQETQKKYSDQLEEKRQSFEMLYTDYMRNGKTMPDSSRTKAEGQLQQMDAEIRQFQQDAQNTFENTKKLFLGPVYLKLGGVIRDVAIENGYSMILPYRIGSGEFLLHTDTTRDVSQLVIKKFTATK
jgi:outer membrane protein